MMGANIESVDYKKLPGYANEMRSTGRKLNQAMTKAYTEIGNLQRSWYGVRYDALVKECNKIIPDINSMLDLVVDTIPYTLQTVAKNYAGVDQSSTAAPSNQKATKITNVKESGKDTLKFMEGNVQTAKTTIFNQFKTASNEMDAIENIFNSKIKNAWKSDAATSYASKFKQLKSSISTSIKNIQQSFDKLVQQTIQDMGQTEKANTVS